MLNNCPVFLSRKHILNGVVNDRSYFFCYPTRSNLNLPNWTASFGFFSYRSLQKIVLNQSFRWSYLLKIFLFFNGNVLWREQVTMCFPCTLFTLEVLMLLLEKYFGLGRTMGNDDAAHLESNFQICDVCHILYLMLFLCSLFSR